MRTLIHEVGYRNHRQWNRGEKPVRCIRKALGTRVPSQKYRRPGHRDDSDRRRYYSISASKTAVHLIVVSH